MLRWLKGKRRKEEAVASETDAWMVRHGRFAYRLAGERAMDAYLLGDLTEQERWHDIREEILERVAPEASVEDTTELLVTETPERP
jgi:hypothetical protein